eukprot:9271558-Alexandrium_andersonii.AAC.1
MAGSKARRPRKGLMGASHADAGQDQPADALAAWEGEGCVPGQNERRGQVDQPARRLPPLVDSPDAGRRETLEGLALIDQEDRPPAGGDQLAPAIGPRRADCERSLASPSLSDKA